MGIPVIGFGDGGSAEYMRHLDNGFVVEEYSVAKLKEAVVFILNEPKLRHDMAQSAKKKVQTDFSVHTMIARYRQVYHYLHASSLKFQGPHSSVSSTPKLLHHSNPSSTLWLSKSPPNAQRLPFSTRQRSTGIDPSETHLHICRSDNNVNVGDTSCRQHGDLKLHAFWAFPDAHEHVNPNPNPNPNPKP
jgi:hypothetical protein